MAKFRLDKFKRKLNEAVEEAVEKAKKELQDEHKRLKESEEVSNMPDDSDKSEK